MHKPLLWRMTALLHPGARITATAVMAVYAWRGTTDITAPKIQEWWQGEGFSPAPSMA